MNKILYITTTFPSTTLTFVYREIEVLSDAGYEIITVSMGKPLKNNISEEALKYYYSTLYLDQISIFKKVFCQLSLFLREFKKYIILFLTAAREKEVKGFKDRIRIIFHFIESGYLYTRFKKLGLHQIHAHFLSGPATIALFLSKYLDIPFSFTIHASSIFTDHIMLKTKLVECKKAVTISHYNKKYLIGRYGANAKNKFKVIHCGVDIDSFLPDDEAKSIPNGILGVGQLVERKGFYYLIEACQRLKEKGLRFRCWIVGEGPERQSLEEKIFMLGLEETVLLLGRQPQEKVKELLKKASIFVLPSIITKNGGREGIPVSLMEAMSMELPVVSTKTAGIPELVENEKDGFLVEPKNAAQLASVLEYLLKNSNTRSKMGKQGRIKVAHEFNISNIPRLFDSIFN